MGWAVKKDSFVRLFCKKVILFMSKINLIIFFMNRLKSQQINCVSAAFIIFFYLEINILLAKHFFQVVMPLLFSNCWSFPKA